MSVNNLGKVFMTPKGQWDKTLSYTKLDIVTNKIGKISSGYIAITDISANTELTDSRWMNLYTLYDGDSGATPNFTIGRVNTLDAGQSATASITGTPENPVLNLGIPRGANGVGEACQIEIDKTLSIEGSPADSKATGDAIKNIEANFQNTLMTYLHVHSVDILDDLDKAEDNRAYLISCNGIKNTPVDGSAIFYTIGFKNTYTIQHFISIEDNKYFVRSKNRDKYMPWKELQRINVDGNNVITANPYKRKTILVLGDSIMAGWGWEEGKGITEPLKEKYTDSTWLNMAESGANMAVTSNPAHTPIVTKITTYTGRADAIIFDGGVNDNTTGVPIGTIESDYDASYNTATFCGAMERALQYIMDKYPLAVKLYIIPHSFKKDTSYLNSIYEKAIEICEKWNMPYLDMRKYAQIAMTELNKNKYTYNPNSKKGDGVHPNEQFYRTHYCPVIDKTLQNLGIAYGLASDIPDIVKVTGVTLNHNAITLEVGESIQLVATVLPSYATNQNVTWSVNNSNVIVENGKIIGKEIGNAIVTVTTLDGNYTAQCSVTINKKSTTTNHTEITSLSLDGNCYFDTEILPDQNTNTEVSLYVDAGTTYICGARDDKYKYGYTCTDNFYAVRGTIDSAAKPSAFWGGNWTIKQNGTTFNFGSSSVDTDSIDSFSLTSPLYIGNMSKNGTNAGTGLKGKIYYAKIYSGDVLISHLIPVKKDDGVLCLYDNVRNKYIYKLGSGSINE